MNKFWALVIMSDMSLKRMWLSSQDCFSILKSDSKVAKIYRSSNDQEAVLGLETVTWQDVKQEDFKHE